MCEWICLEGAKNSEPLASSSARFSINLSQPLNILRIRSSAKLTAKLMEQTRPAILTSLVDVKLHTSRSRLPLPSAFVLRTLLGTQLCP